MNHRSATVGVRERHAIGAGELGRILAAARAIEGLAEIVILSTCNRVEAYLVGTEDAARQVEALVFGDDSGAAGGSGEQPLYRSAANQAAEHLFRVAAGLDSMVPGDQQILGQVEAAWRAAREAEASGAELDALFAEALRVGHAVQEIPGFLPGERASVPAAAVSLAGRVLGGLSGRHLVFLGTGKMAVLAARLAKETGASRITIAGRNRGHAEAAAAAVGGECADFDNASNGFASADAVICATAAPGYLAIARDLAAALESRPADAGDLVIIDISVPRNIDPAAASLPRIRLFNMDHLHQEFETSAGVAPAVRRRAEELVRNAATDFAASHQPATLSA